MNAEEFGKHVARLMAERDAKHAADVAELRGRIDTLQEMVKTIPDTMVRAIPVLPGPPGEKGEPGKDGTFTLEDVHVEHDGERTFTLLGKSFVLPVPIFRDVFERGAGYQQHDIVQYGGNMWICKVESTTEQPGTGKDWKLVVRKGRDAREKV